MIRRWVGWALVWQRHVLSVQGTQQHHHHILAAGAAFQGPAGTGTATATGTAPPQACDMRAMPPTHSVLACACPAVCGWHCGAAAGSQARGDTDAGVPGGESVLYTAQGGVLAAALPWVLHAASHAARGSNRVVTGHSSRPGVEGDVHMHVCVTVCVCVGGWG